MVQFGSIQFQKNFNGSFRNWFGFDTLEPNQTIADCYLRCNTLVPTSIIGRGDTNDVEEELDH